MTNTSNLPVEALELEYPLTLLRYELVNGSAGGGTYRGGMGLRRVYRAEAPCKLSLHASRFQSQPWGLAGGLAAGGSSADFGDGRTSFVGSIPLVAGQVVEIVTPGGGGYGDPAGRSADAVARDIAEQRISAAYAERTYGRAASSAAA